MTKNAKAKPHRRIATAVRQFFSDWPMHITTAVLLLLVFVVARQQVGILIYKAALLTLAACIAYWIARWVLRVDPEDASDEERRDVVLLICAAVLAAGLAA